MGRHADATRDTSAVHSRDLGVAAVRSLQGVIDDICSGAFAPDETRRGYFPSRVIDADAAGQDNLTTVEVGPQQDSKVELIEVKEDHDECIDLLSDDDQANGADGDFQHSESSSDEASSSESDLEVMPTQPKFIKVITSFKESHGIAYKHPCSKLVHYVVASEVPSIKQNLVFSCGRKLSDKYERTKSFDPFNMCRLCKRQGMQDGALQD